MPTRSPGRAGSCRLRTQWQTPGMATCAMYRPKARERSNGWKQLEPAGWRGGLFPRGWSASGPSPGLTFTFTYVHSGCYWTGSMGQEQKRVRGRVAALASLTASACCVRPQGVLGLRNGLCQADYGRSPVGSMYRPAGCGVAKAVCIRCECSGCSTGPTYTSLQAARRPSRLRVLGKAGRRALT